MYDAWSWPNDYGLACPPSPTTPHYPCSDPHWLNSSYCECRAPPAFVSNLSASAALTGNVYARKFLGLVRRSLPGFGSVSSPHGAFLHSCFSHVVAAYGGWGRLGIGGVGFRDAVIRWFNEEPSGQRGQVRQASKPIHTHVHTCYTHARMST